MCRLAVASRREGGPSLRSLFTFPRIRGMSRQSCRARGIRAGREHVSVIFGKQTDPYFALTLCRRICAGSHGRET